MRRTALYSSAGPKRPAPAPKAAPQANGRATAAAPRWARLAALRRLSPNDPRLLWTAMALLALALAVCVALLLIRAPRALTQKTSPQQYSKPSKKTCCRRLRRAPTRQFCPRWCG